LDWRSGAWKEEKASQKPREGKSYPQGEKRGKAHIKKKADRKVRGGRKSHRLKPVGSIVARI